MKDSNEMVKIGAFRDVKKYYYGGGINAPITE